MGQKVALVLALSSSVWFRALNISLFLQAHKSSSQLPHHFSIKPEPHFDFVRPHKKYTKRPKLDPLRQPSRVERQHTVNKADIKQYDFHSSGEEDYPLVSTALRTY